MSYVPTVKCWKRFRDGMFVFFEHSRGDLDNFFNFMTPKIHLKKIQLTISCPTDLSQNF